MPTAGVVQRVASDQEQIAVPRAEAGQREGSSMEGQPADLEGSRNHAHSERPLAGEKDAGSCPQAQVLRGDDIEAWANDKDQEEEPGLVWVGFEDW